MEWAGLFTTHLEYHRWATRRIHDMVAALSDEERGRARGTAHESIEGTLVHLYQADCIWLARLEDQPTGSLDAYAPPIGDAAWREAWEAVLERLYQRGLALIAADPERVLDYRTAQGIPSRTPVWQVLLHVVNHGTLHRGQIMALLRQAGAVPVATDLIAYYRSL